MSIARALACDPAILFLDEPIAALDPPTRRSLVDDLLQILDSRGIAAVWVTHDRDEALAVGDSVTFIERGEVVQTGPAMDVFSRPATESFAAFLGLDTYLEGTVVAGPAGDLRFILRDGQELSCGEAPLGHAVACIPPEDVVLLTTAPEHSMSLRNVLQGDGEGGAAGRPPAARPRRGGRPRDRRAGDQGGVRGAGPGRRVAGGRRLQGGGPPPHPSARAGGAGA